MVSSRTWSLVPAFGILGMLVVVESCNGDLEDLVCDVSRAVALPGVTLLRRHLHLRTSGQGRPSPERD
jgi:hypothetical protein